jgi:hypothetical protein
MHDVKRRPPHAPSLTQLTEKKFREVALGLDFHLHKPTDLTNLLEP